MCKLEDAATSTGTCLVDEQNAATHATLGGSEHKPKPACLIFLQLFIGARREFTTALVYSKQLSAASASGTPRNSPNLQQFASFFYQFSHLASPAARGEDLLGDGA